MFFHFVLGPMTALATALPHDPPGAHSHDGPTSAAQDQSPRYLTNRPRALELPLPDEEEAFVFAVFGDRTGGPAEGIAVLAQAVDEVNLFEPDLVMTVGDLINGYNLAPEWLAEMDEYKKVMNGLLGPWFPVAGNHDVYWRGEGDPPPGEHEPQYETHFGPLWYAFRHKSSWFIVLYSDEGNPETGEKTFSKPDAQRMSPEQFAWLSNTLYMARDADHVFVFLHHPRWIGGGYGNDWNRVHERLRKAGNVTAVFAGHIHRMRYDERDGIEYFTLATVGGHQSGVVPEAGYLHHYMLVTVRPDHIAAVSLPVGEATDPRSITGEVSDGARTLAQRLQPAWSAPVSIDAAGGTETVIEVTFENPVARPVELTALSSSSDVRWELHPEHVHARLEPNETRTFELRASRAASGLDETFRTPTLELKADYLSEAARISLPMREFRLPLEASSLSAPARPSSEGYLHLDGVDDHASVPADAIDLPDGPMTVECWFRADGDVNGGRNLVAKTESSEYGIGYADGVPAFFLHLDGSYRRAVAPSAAVEAGSGWHHMAGVFDGAKVHVYLDGELLASAEASGQRTRNQLPLMIGCDVTRAGGGTSFAQGAIDEVRLSDVARYSGESFTPERRFEPDANTRLLLHMDGSTGPWLYDSSPESKHPLIHGDARVHTEPGSPAGAR